MPNILTVVEKSDTSPYSDTSLSDNLTIKNEDWILWAEKNGITTLMPENIEDYMTVRNGAGPCKSDIFVPNQLAERALILGYMS